VDNISTSVIVPIWNGHEHLPVCLDALLAQAAPSLEIIAVDNGSTDGSAALVHERYPQVRLIENGRNLGFAGGCNVGLQAARGECLILVNQDVIVQAGWLEAMVKALSLPEVGIGGGKLLYPDGTIQHAGGTISYPLAHTDHYGRHEMDKGQWSVQREVDYVTGALMGLKRTLLDRVGLFDEGFFPAYYEEADLCTRARAHGFRILYAPDCVGIHHETTTTAKTGVVKNRWVERGRLRFVLKHYTTQQFYTDFLPAERTWLATAPDLALRQGLRMAYLDILLGLQDVPRTGVLSEETATEAVAEALIGLRGILTGFLPGASQVAPYPDRWIEPPWRVPSRSFIAKIPVLGLPIIHLFKVLHLVWRLPERLAAAQEILLCLDREVTENSIIQNESAYASPKKESRVGARVDASEET